MPKCRLACQRLLEDVAELVACIRDFVVLRAVWDIRQFKNHTANVKQQVLFCFMVARARPRKQMKAQNMAFCWNSTSIYCVAAAWPA